jgi:hypothetical protein
MGNEKDNIISFTVGKDVIHLSEKEAVVLRDSLCARLGCPSFCCSGAAGFIEDTTIASSMSIDNIVVEN